MNWMESILDLVLIGIVGAGLIQASRLISHLADLRKSRNDMQRFVQEFNTTVQRAEAGIKGLRTAARDSGDDLEKLIERALQVRDELSFLTESADQLADRLSDSASTAAKEPKSEPKASASTVSAFAPRQPEAKDSAPPASRAEKELLQALKKLS